MRSIFVSYPLACPKLVLARAYSKGELLRRQFFPILMIFPAITELVNCILKILLYHDCLPFGKLLHMGGNVTKRKYVDLYCTYASVCGYKDSKDVFSLFICSFLDHLA